MKRPIINIIFSLVILVAAISVALIPAFWERKALDYINGMLPDAKLTIERISGHPFTEIQLEKLVFLDSRGIKARSDVVEVKLNLIKSLFSKLSLKELAVVDLDIEITSEEKRKAGDQSGENYFYLNEFPDFGIDRFSLTGSLLVNEDKELFLRGIDFKGSLESAGKILGVEIASLAAETVDPFKAIHLDRGRINIFAGHLEVNNLGGKIRGLAITGNMILPFSKKAVVSGDITFSNLGDMKPDHLYPLKTVKLNFKLDDHLISGALEAVDDKDRLVEGIFSAGVYPDFIKFDNIELNHENSKIALDGVMEIPGRIAGRAEITGLDILPWYTYDRSTDISGLILFECELSHGSLDNAILAVELMEKDISSTEIVSVSGTVVYQDSVLTTSDPVIVGFGASLAIADGRIDLRSKQIDLGLELTRADVNVLNTFLKDSIETGIFTGEMEIHGPLTEPDIKMSLVGENVNYKGFYLESVTTNATLKTSEKYQTGLIQLDLGKGTYKDYGFNQGSGDIRIDSSTVHFQNIYFNRDEDYVQLDAILESDGTVNVSRIQTAYNGHYFVNVDPVRLTMEPKGRFSVKHFVFHVDDGVVEGEISYEDHIAGHVKLTNIDAEIFHIFLEDERYKITGIIFGEIQTFTIDSTQNFSVEASIRNGKILRWNFDDLIISMAYNRGVLSIDEFVMTSGDFVGFEMTGILPMKAPDEIGERLDIKSSYKNFDLNLMSTLLFPDFFHLGGTANGNLDINGTLSATKMDFDLAVKDAEFDILDLGTFRAAGQYDANRLNLSHLSSVTNLDTITGSGFVPFNFNLGSQRFGKFFKENPIYLDLKGRTSRIDFLTQYLTDVDSIPGDFDINLILSGPMSGIIRDGSIRITDADVYTTLLDDPVRNVNASGTLTNNILSINNMTVTLPNPAKPEKSRDAVVTGTIDLTRFFKPKYNLNLTGEDAFFRTLTGDIEGVVDLDLRVRGRDTISITGNIPVQDVKLYQEFAASTVETMSNPKPAIILDYRINFPIPGELRLINSQVDARMTGEVSLIQFGNLETVYSGELFITSGKFYYYGDIFTITDGYIALDKKGFNPYLDIHANTSIEDEDIYINLVGNMDNPQLNLSSASGFSQSDILELLTWRKRFEDQEMSSAGFGSQAQALVGVWFENQLEKNFLRMTGLKELGLVEDVSISGTSTLLNPSTDTDVSIKAELTDNVALNYAYRRSFSLANPENSMLGVELKLNRYVSLVANVDKTGNLHVKYRLRYSY